MPAGAGHATSTLASSPNLDQEGCAFLPALNHFGSLVSRRRSLPGVLCDSAGPLPSPAAPLSKETLKSSALGASAAPSPVGTCPAWEGGLQEMHGRALQIMRCLCGDCSCSAPDKSPLFSCLFFPCPSCLCGGEPRILEHTLSRRSSQSTVPRACSAALGAGGSGWPGALQRFLQLCPRSPDAPGKAAAAPP